MITEIEFLGSRIPHKEGNVKEDLGIFDETFPILHGWEIQKGGCSSYKNFNWLFLKFSSLFLTVLRAFRPAGGVCADDCVSAS